MRAILYLLLIVLASPAARGSETAPDFVLPDANGREVRLATEVADRPVILFFWASWCPYCKALLPHMQSISLEYGDAVRILAIHFRDDADPVAFMQDAGYEFTILPNGNEIADAYDVYATPGVIIVDRQQAVRFNLYRLPRREPPAVDGELTHSRKAAFRAPYWAAEIRRTLDSVLQTASPTPR